METDPLNPSSDRDSPGGDNARNFDVVLERLITASGATSETDFGKKLGIKQPSIAAARRRGAIPPNWVVAIARAYGFSADWLLFGEGPMRRGESKTPVISSTLLPDGTQIDFVSLKIAITRLDSNNELVIGKYWPWELYSRKYLMELGDPDSMVFIPISGDAMLPAFKDRQFVIIDTSQIDIEPDKIYAVGVDGFVLIRIVRIAPGKLILDGYNCKTLEVNPGDIKILGLVVRPTMEKESAV